MFRSHYLEEKMVFIVTWSETIGPYQFLHQRRKENSETLVVYQCLLDWKTLAGRSFAIRYRKNQLQMETSFKRKWFTESQHFESVSVVMQMRQLSIWMKTWILYWVHCTTLCGNTRHHLDNSWFFTSCDHTAVLTPSTKYVESKRQSKTTKAVIL